MSFPANEATLCNPYPPAPEYISTPTPAVDAAAPIDLSDSHHDANFIENIQVVGTSYVDVAAIFNKRYETVVNNMSRLESLMCDNTDNPDFSYDQYSNLYKTLGRAGESRYFERRFNVSIQRGVPT
ncbi:hypothetical protein BGZ49_001524 [Haplosporangium sp. Z 27]|nr:hypothetical protein BGZ49_001524 [Haplosporangium sp. Z 27]